MLPLLFSLLSGALLTTAFAPFDYWFFNILAPAGLIFLVSYYKQHSAWRLGFAFGLGFFASSVSWIYISIHQFGDSPAPLAAAITAVFIAYLALFPATFAWLSRWFSQHFAGQARLIFLIAISWVLLEWLRGVLFTGFPWVFLGYSFLDSPFEGLAPVLGVYGLSFLAILLASALALSMQLSSRRLTPAVLVALTLLIIACPLHQFNWTERNGQYRSVALVQANIPQDLKWQSENQHKIIDTYLKLSQPYWHKNLLIWSESAITIPLPYAQDLLDSLQQQAAAKNGNLITGIPVQSASHPGQFYNGMVSVGAQPGNKVYKQHLVPFGEYVPLENWLRGIIDFFDLPMSNFIARKRQGPLQAAHLALQPAICYEIAYPDLVLEQAENTEALLTISNDTWFGDSIGPKQHLQIARFRALETGRMLLRSTNSGLTAIIDQHGTVKAMAEPFIATVLSGTLQGRRGQTPLMIYQHQGIIMTLVLLALGLLLTDQRFLIRLRLLLRLK